MYLNFQIRQSPHKLLIKPTYSIDTAIVFVPRLIVILCGFAEGADDAFEIMCVLKPDVFFDERDPDRLPVCWKRSTCHIYPRCGWDGDWGNYTQGYRQPMKSTINLMPEHWVFGISN